MNRICNIIFDLGGVLYEIGYGNIAKAIERYGVTNVGEFFSRSYQTHEMDLFEEGLLSAAQFRDYMRGLVPGLSDGEIDNIVNAVLIDMPKEHVDLLHALRGRYKVYLFSNTNAINCECFHQHCKEKFGYDVFEECFEKAYFSHEMHIRKPKVEGFVKILESEGLKADETLFVDDNKPNLVGAGEAGMQTCWLKPGHDVCELFDQELNFVDPQFE